MDTANFLVSLFSNYSFLPALAICVCAMKNKSRFSLWKSVAILFAIMIPTVLVFSVQQAKFPLPYNCSIYILGIFSFIVLGILFPAEASKRFCIFAYACTLMSFANSYSTWFDCFLHPESNIENFSIEAGIFHIVFSTVIALLFIYPLSRFGAKLVDTFSAPKLWYCGLTVSLFFLFINILIVPKKYETLHINRMFTYYGIILSIVFVLYLYLCVEYYFILTTIGESAESKLRDRLLEMQENVYAKQTQYLLETSKQRHDFKNLIKTFDMLAESGDYDVLKELIHDTAENIPQNDTKLFTINAPVNSLLNHYMTEARDSGIKLNWEVDIPDAIPIKATDICNILGNILDNAIMACKNVEASDAKFIDLSITFENNSALYIAVTNSISINTAKPNENYLAILKNKNGIGMEAIRSIAHKYHGTANFSSENNEFYSEIMLRAGSR